MKNGTIKEIKSFSLIGANKGRQILYYVNEYLNGELVGTSEAVYEEVSDSDVDEVADTIPSKNSSKAKGISALIKGNTEYLEEIKRLDKEIDKKKREGKIK